MDRTDPVSRELAEIDEAECRWLLRRRSAGRVAFVVDGDVMVMPLNYVMYGDDIVVRTSDGSAFLAAVTGSSSVSFQVDRLDPADGGGWSWSVLALTAARPVDDVAELEVLGGLALDPWAPGVRDRYVVLRPRALTGRRVPHGPPVASM